MHYLNGAIRLQPLGERVTPNAKAHLSVLLALAAFTKAVDYWLRRFELVDLRRHVRSTARATPTSTRRSRPSS